MNCIFLIELIIVKLLNYFCTINFWLLSCNYIETDQTFHS